MPAATADAVVAGAGEGLVDEAEALGASVSAGDDVRAGPVFPAHPASARVGRLAAKSAARVMADERLGATAEALTNDGRGTPPWYHAAAIRALVVRLWALGVAPSLLVACAAPPRVTAPPRSVPAPRPPAKPWSRFGEVSAWPAAGEPFENRGHPGAGERVQIRVSPEARDAYASLVADTVLQPGSVVAAFHSNAAGVAGAVFVMIKEPSTWTYLALDKEGRPAALAMSGCRGCHADAVGDSLFGLPRARAPER
jgi:hypothetical protein